MAAPPPPSTGPEVDLDRLGQVVMCFSQTIYRSNGVWEGPDPLAPMIPLFILQIMTAILSSRILNFVLKPFNQPPLVAEILSGIILGPSMLGNIEEFRKHNFPNHNFETIETMGHFALVLYAFLTGLQMDVKAIVHTGTKSRIVAVSGSIFPFLIGAGFYFTLQTDTQSMIGFIFCGSALTVTGFSTLAKILDSKRLLNTEIGKIAASSALINVALSWVLLTIGLLFTGSLDNVQWAVLCTVGFVVVCVNYVRPLLNWLISKTPEGQGFSEFYICSFIAVICAFGCFTDAMGSHPMIGAFIFGLIMPNNELLRTAILDRLEDFVMGILMPVFFLVCGLRTNIFTITDGDTSIFTALALILLACSAKIIAALVASCYTGMSTNEAIGLGVLTNTKSTMVMIILEVGQVQQVLSVQQYSMMVVACLIMTIVATPLAARYCPKQDLEPYKRRTIQNAKPGEELRILACIHGTNNLPAIISLLETSNSTVTSPITAFGVQLLELVGRAPAMMVVHSSGSGRHVGGSHEEVQTSQIISTFDNYELRSHGVTAQVLTARWSYDTMAEDICKMAKEKRAAFLVLPFHKQQGTDGEMEDTNPAIQTVNEGVLLSAPCSVGILVERGRPNQYAKNIAVLYLGGPDDREALTYARRMSGLPGVHLTVIRFVPAKDVSADGAVEDPDLELELTRETSFVTVSIDPARDKEEDEELLNNFRTETAEDDSKTFMELVLDDEEEFTKAVKSLDDRSFDLYVAGRGRGVSSALTSGLADWCECPELGAVGDLLVTSEFESSFSVLVVQQYVRTNKGGAGGGSSSASSTGAGGSAAESMSQRMDADMQMDMGFRMSYSDEPDAAYDSPTSSISRKQQQQDHYIMV
ncbi:PREDICTED: cation/H(+) antiporter 15-like [Ipomoea nil]|uniref:cation/H(+) antiporter 15-like n=1 Tax=Ipomoea nil TaxID=35883 RepID=UPI000901C377|nr:PREDICTED: cation/H(+) antiporter 15-like [Ipomoea nil]